MIAILAVVLASAGACADCSVEVQDPPRPPAPPFDPALPRAHDPVIAREGERLYVFTTGRGVGRMSSADGKTWEAMGPALDPVPSWTATTIPGSRDHYWAPDILRWDGKWRLYYSVSTFGKNRSAIGLATSPTLDPAAKGYGWKDEGIVVESQPSDDHNAIDPNVVLDAKGTPWLSWGSFWSGLKMIRLDRKTGKPAEGANRISIAARNRTDSPPNEIEAPFIYRRGSNYYLFVSWDVCCRGVSSTYNIRVGRSRKVDGPYLDRSGKSLAEGGGTLVRKTEGRWIGPGHNAVFKDGRDEWLVYHAYDKEDRGAPKLRMERLRWSKDGWPEVDTAPSAGSR